MSKPDTCNGDLTQLPPALVPLTTEPRWVTWVWEERTTKNGSAKWTKPPRLACDPSRNARTNDPATWGSYADAVAAVGAGRADGIGFMLLGSSVGAIDLDHCVDRASAKLDTWAEALQQEAIGSYIETTVSGSGMRILGTVLGDELHRRFAIDRTNGAGVELYRNCARFITVSGKEFSRCPKLPPIDGLIDRLFERYTERQAGGLDFNDAGPQPSSAIDFDAIIANGAPEGQRSELFQAVVWHLAQKGYTAEEIAEELARHPHGIGAKYAGRLLAEVARSHAKWQSRKRNAATGMPSAAAQPWPQIRVVPGELPRVVNEAEEALLQLGREIYQRGGLIVRPVLSQLKATDDRDTQGWRLVSVSKSYLAETLTCAARFLRFDRRAMDWVAINAPDQIAETYLHREGLWKMPLLTGVTTTPFLRPDGSLCETPGYDPVSGLLFKPDDCIFPPIPPSPSKADALAALAQIEQLISSFPFVTTVDRAVALSAILTALDRRGMATAPLHAFTAPSAGTGKSLLVDVVAMLATGRPMPVISQGKTEEELEKRLASALLAGDVAISIDNCEVALQGSFLCQALTQQVLNIRLLGLSKNVPTLVNASIFATGNNLTIAGDLTRRVLMCALNAGCEHPEQRSFASDPIATVRRARGALVAAVLTVLRAWHVAGEKDACSPLGSFEQWSHRVRAPLIWLGYPDPCETTLKVKSGDPHLMALGTVMAQWKQNIGLGMERTVQQVINVGLGVSDFQVALCNVAAARSGNLVSNDRLGRWLRKIEGRVVDGLVFRRTGIVAGYPTWQLMRT